MVRLQKGGSINLLQEGNPTPNRYGQCSSGRLVVYSSSWVCKQIDIWRIYMNLEILREYNFIITYISSLTPNTYRSVHLYCHSLWESDKCEVLSLLGSRYKLSLSILPNTKHISMVFCFSSWVCNRQTPPCPHQDMLYCQAFMTYILMHFWLPRNVSFVQRRIDQTPNGAHFNRREWRKR